MESPQDESNLLQELKTLVQESNDLQQFGPLITTRFLLHFIRGKKYNVSKAFTTVTNYFAVRRKYSGIFKSLDPREVKMLDSGAIRVLKDRDDKGRLYLVVDAGKWDPSEFSLEDIVVSYVLLAEQLWSIQSFETHGFSVIFDMASLTLSHTTLFTPSAIKFAVSIAWNSFPVRFKGVYFLNSTFIVSLLMKIISPFVPTKLKERLHIWRTHESSQLHQLIPPHKLPPSLRSFGSSPPQDDPEDPHDIYDEQIVPRIRSNVDFYATLARCL